MTETPASNLELLDPNSNLYKAMIGARDLHMKNRALEAEKRLERLKLIEQTKIKEQ